MVHQLPNNRVLICNVNIALARVSYILFILQNLLLIFREQTHNEIENETKAC